MGYCEKCYPYILKIEHSKLWDLDDPKTLKDYPGGWIYNDKRTYNIIKSGLPKEWQFHLDWLKFREIQLSRQIDGMEIEQGLQMLAKRCGLGKKNLFHGCASRINDLFNQEQKKQIFEWIDKIEQNIPWQADMDKVFGVKK